MKKLALIIILFGSIISASAQDSNILMSLADPVFGVRIKANFPTLSGNWARGFFVANENNTKNLFSMGAFGGTVAGVANIKYGWIGQDYTNIYMSFLPNGNIGIGTLTPTEKLSVKGNIRAREIKVETNNWPDFVFNENYRHESLPELESFIKRYKHLPNMPTAKQAEDNGIELGEMNKRLLQKIEEITLHLIEKDKQLQVQDARINKLEELFNLSQKSK